MSQSPLRKFSLFNKCDTIYTKYAYKAYFINSLHEKGFGMEENTNLKDVHRATEEALTTRATISTGLVKKKTPKPAIYCGAWIRKKSKYCKRRVKVKGDSCVYHSSGVAATSIPTVATVIAKKQTIYCGVWISEKNKSCRSRVKTKGKHCTYHSENSLPYKTATCSKAGPTIPYKWKDWGLLSREFFVDRQLGIVLKHAHTSVKDDKPGWIYIYYLKDDESEFYWKIGRTSRKLQERIKEWPGAILKGAVEVPFNKLAERIIHLILDQNRILRYVYEPAKQKTSGKLYLTVRKGDKTLVVDKLVTDLRDKDKKTESFSPIPQKDIEAVRQYRPVAFGNRKKEIEWFNAKFDVICDVVLTVNNSLMKWKNGNK